MQKYTGNIYYEGSGQNAGDSDMGTTEFCIIKGRWLCCTAFTSITDFREESGRRRVELIADSSTRKLHVWRSSTLRERMCSTENIVFSAFFRWFSSKYGLGCSRGRRSRKMSPFHLFISDMMRIHSRGTSMWPKGPNFGSRNQNVAR